MQSAKGGGQALVVFCSFSVLIRNISMLSTVPHALMRWEVTCYRISGGVVTRYGNICSKSGPEQLQSAPLAVATAVIARMPSDWICTTDEYAKVP
jgi:hypothetical protein